MTLSDANITYGPVDVPKPVAENIWIVDSGPIRVGGLSLPVRMVVVRLASGGVWLHSPTRCTPDLARAIGEIGPVRHLVAPNVAHWSFVQDWQAQCPGAVTWAAPGLRARKPVQRSGLRLDHDLAAAAPAEWAADIDQAMLRGGAGFREAAFLHRASRSLILTDLVQSLDPAKLPTGTRLFARLAGSLAPGGVPRHLRLVLRLRRADSAAALSRVLAWQPERVIFAHGRWFDRDGAAELRRVFAPLVG